MTGKNETEHVDAQLLEPGETSLVSNSSKQDHSYASPDDSLWGRVQNAADAIGANRAVVALSVGRMGDAIGNSLLFVVIPLYVAELPSQLLDLPNEVRTGIILSRPQWAVGS